MLVIGIVGRKGSGKNELVNHLHARCGLPSLSLGGFVRNIALREGIRPTRANLFAISQRYFAMHGRDHFVAKAIQEIEREQLEAVVISGIRSPEEVTFLRERFGDAFLLVHIQVTDLRTRFERTQERGDPRDVTDYATFLLHDQTEEQLFSLTQTIDCADIRIDNSGTLHELHRQIQQSLVESIVSARMTCT
jgi:dephospho-CoA kinase